MKPNVLGVWRRGEGESGRQHYQGPGKRGGATHLGACGTRGASKEAGGNERFCGEGSAREEDRDDEGDFFVIGKGTRRMWFSSVSHYGSSLSGGLRFSFRLFKLVF